MTLRSTTVALALAAGLALPASAALAQSTVIAQPPGYFDDGRLNVFGAQVDSRYSGTLPEDRTVSPHGYGSVNAPMFRFGDIPGQ